METVVKSFRNLMLAVSVTLLSALGVSANAADGLIAVKSPYSAKETLDRFEETAKQRGLLIFARIDHAAGAAKIGKSLRPTEVLIFGNPQGGTPLMECAQSVGIDLPLKALAWEDDKGQVWIGYNDLAYIGKRHETGQCAALENVAKALGSMTAAVVTK
jgi:uncharacterized protein (DUF302 family)